MAAKSYGLEFNGYWREPNISGLPAKSGIYCVYACVYDSVRKTVDLKRLLYIGESADVQNRVQNHEGWTAWKRELKAGEVICISAALIAGDSDRQRAEAAMILKHKPRCNTEYVDSFPFDTTSITTSGKNALLQSFFTVHRTESTTAKSRSGYGSRWI